VDKQQQQQERLSPRHLVARDRLLFPYGGDVDGSGLHSFSIPRQTSPKTTLSNLDQHGSVSPRDGHENMWDRRARRGTQPTQMGVF